jgi:phosphopantothenoylcysteine synthetase/decarboxylase
MKIVITSGASREPIDAVRYVSNISTGTTGAQLAQAMALRGHTVVLLHGAGAVTASSPVEHETFSSAEDLRVRLEHRLGQEDIDLVVMAAAVADYRPAQSSSGKLSSDNEGLSLQLVRNEKILPQLKSFARRPVRVVGFKLTVGADDRARAAAVKAQFERGGVDAVVHNDLTEIRSAVEHPFRLYESPTKQPTLLGGTVALAEAVLGLGSS